tara:strand:- start:1258 stop:1389 length:132 start_codon:yes stop_codon:yes gene_type:complete
LLFLKETQGVHFIEASIFMGCKDTQVFGFGQLNKLEFITHFKN